MNTPITGKTRLISLLGSPVSHSGSPRMHNGVYQALGLDFVYLAFDVGPDQVEDAIRGLRAMNFRGSNVTTPLKQAVLPWLDRLTEAAELAGAVNVIVNDDGVLTGHITDGEGYMRSLTESGVDPVGRTLTLIGAGGASTAVAIQAAIDGVKAISIFNPRDRFQAAGEKTAAMLRARFGCEAHLFDLADRDALRRELARSDILTQATPIGMEATIDQCVIPDASYFHPDLVVTDLIYVPAETRLLKMARAAGNRTVSGMGMQLFQAVSAFRMWTGHDMPVELARRFLFGPVPNH